jgi:nucleoside-diphosphate-sugar epimerase
MVFTGNLVHGMLLAETAEKAPGNAYWIADAQPYELGHIFDTIRDALAAEGLEVTERRPIRVPALVGSIAEAADKFVQDRGRYVQAVHVLGELKDTIACDVSRARDEIGYEPPVDLLEGMRLSIRWCLAHGEQL